VIVESILATGIFVDGDVVPTSALGKESIAVQVLTWYGKEDLNVYCRPITGCDSGESSQRRSSKINIGFENRFRKKSTL
jgi:hypothetical protein